MHVPALMQHQNDQIHSCLKKIKFVETPKDLKIEFTFNEHCIQCK